MMLSGEPPADLIRRRRRRAASSPIGRGADGDGGQRRPMHRAFGNVVEADHRDVAAGREAAIGEAQHDAERAQVVVAEDGGRGVGVVSKQLADRARRLPRGSAGN